MFSWICARCGRDNSPSANHCLSCGASFDAPASEPEPVKAPPPVQRTYPPDDDDEPIFRAPSVAATPRPTPAPTRAPERVAPVVVEREPPVPERVAPARSPFSAYAEQPREAVVPASGGRAPLPTWLLTILFFIAIVGIGAAIYYGIQYFRGGKAATSTGLDSAANVARTKLTNPLQKYVEVVGIRLVEGPKKQPEAKFVVVNHSNNDIDNLNATVTLWASTSRSEEDSVGTFAFKVGSLPAYESKEFTAPLNTKLKFYELPDWQNATPEVQITSP